MQAATFPFCHVAIVNGIAARKRLTVPAEWIEHSIPEGAGFTGPLHTPVADRLRTGGKTRTLNVGFGDRCAPCAHPHVTLSGWEELNLHHMVPNHA